VSVSILIATYGEQSWLQMAQNRALPSADSQGAYEVHQGHYPEATIAQARNRLAEDASGDWLIFLDADDELGPGYVTGMMRSAARKGVPERALLTPAVSYWYPGRRRANSPRFLPHCDLSQGNYLVLGTMVQRDLFRQVGGFSDYPHGYEDWSLWAKCWKAGAKVIQVRRAVYIAHVDPNSKHRVAWRDREYQVQMHEQVRRDLFPEEYA
jgi:GT2 family glycosyltransferase